MSEPTSPIWGTREQEQARGQRKAVQLLERAKTAGLPVVQWTVGAGGVRLTGHVEAHDQAESRRQFEAWVALIGAEPQPERTSLGQVQLWAFVKNLEGGLASVGIVAELDDPAAASG